MVYPAVSQAQQSHNVSTLTLSISELTTALDQANNQAYTQGSGSTLDPTTYAPLSVSSVMLEKIQATLNQSGWLLSEGQLILERSSGSRTVEDGCTSTLVRYMNTSIRLNNDSALAIELRSLHDPIAVSLDLNATVLATGRAQQVFGFRLGRCQELASDNFDFAVGGELALSANLTINLNPTLFDDGTLVLQPRYQLDATLNRWSPKSDVDDSIARAIIEKVLLADLEDALSQQRLAAEINAFNTDANNTRLISAPSGQLDNSINNLRDGDIVVQLPEPNDEQVQALYRLVSSNARFPVTLDYVRSKQLPLMSALLIGDGDSLEQILNNALACEASQVLETSLRPNPLYVIEGGQCIETQRISADTPYFTNAACDAPVTVLPENKTEFCDTVLSPEKLGNAAVNTQTQDTWSLSPGSRFNIGTLPLDDRAQPYTQRTRYRTINTENGECALEMRVYSPHPNATGLTPLIAFHGGSWQYRSTGFLGVEFTATHFTNQGFVVFAPFYRLIGSKDGNTSCQNASLNDIITDAESALSWVNENATRYGATGKPVVFGQSAGGHLAAYLGTHHHEQVDRAIVYYAPVDFEQFATDIQSGDYTFEPGIDILEALTGQSQETVALDSSLIINNTFTRLIESQVADTPESVTPFFMLYGLSDELLPASQAQRLCNALSGDVTNGPGNIGTGTELRYTVNCDERGSELHFITEGQHALDLCIAPGLCRAGDAASASLTADSLNTVLDWSRKKLPTAATTDDSNTTAATEPLQNQSSSGSGIVDPMLLFVLALLSIIVFWRDKPQFLIELNRRHHNGN